LLAGRERAAALRELGVWAFHGAKDPVVPLEESERMVDAFKKAGVKEVKFTVYPEADHNSWTAAYNTPELYDWLLKHRRSAPAKREVVVSALRSPRDQSRAARAVSSAAN